MRRLLDRLVPSLVRLILRVFFRHLEVVGGQRLPASGPLLIVANHNNSLIDPLLVIAASPRMPRFLAKSTLWQNPLLRPFLDLGGVIPVYRRHDPGVDTARNQETFSRCHEALRDGGVISLFPEGISHSEPQLQPLKTGAARIALEAEERFGPLGVRLAPVGLVFDAKETFRSNALVQVGVAMTAADFRDSSGPLGEEAAQETVRRLTVRLDEDLRDLTLNYESWQEARLIEHAADVYARPEGAVPERVPLVEGVPLRRAFLEGYRRLRREHPEQIAAVAKAVREYDGLLAAFGLRDDQVGAAYRRGPVLRYVGRSLLRLLVLLPVAAVGTLLNWLPYRIPGWAAGRFGDLDDTKATYKVFTGFVTFPLFWAAEIAAAAWLGGPVLGGGWLGGLMAGLAMAVVAPASGWIALRFHEQRGRFLGEARAFLRLQGGGRLGDELRERRRRVRALVEEAVKMAAPPGP